MNPPRTAEAQQKQIARLSLRAGNLMAVPAVVTRAIQCIDNPGSSVLQLAAILNTDQTLAGRLIGIANSVVFRGSRRFVTVREAIVRMGYRTVRDLLFATVVAGLAKAPSRLYEMGPEDLWRHSVAAALAAQVLAEELRSFDPEHAYITGLLHDVGRLVLDRAMTPTEIDSVRASVSRDRISYQEAEREVLGVAHAEVGGYHLTRWGVAPEVAEAVARHHSPRPATLSALVHTADVVAVRVMDLSSGDPGRAYAFDPGILAGDALSPALTEPQLQAIVGKVRTGLAAAAAMV